MSYWMARLVAVIRTRSGRRESLQLRLELDSLSQEARQRQLAGLDQHGIGTFA